MRVQYSGTLAESHIGRMVRADKLRLLFRQSFPALFVSLVAAGLLCWVLWASAERAMMLAWLAVLLASTVVRLGLFLAYFRIRPQGVDLLRWEWPYAVTLMASSAIWGVGGLLVMPVQDRVGQVFTFFVLIGMAGGAVTV